MKRLINHIRRWNVWRKWNRNSRWHKFLVLCGVIYSPTFELTDYLEKKKDELSINGYRDTKVTYMDHYPEREKDNGTLDH